MTGSILSQMQHLFEASGIDMIERMGRWDAKRIAKRQGAKTSAQIGAVTPVCSYATGDKYRDVWLLACKYSKEEFVMFDIEHLRADDIRGFLVDRVIEAGLSLRTFLTYAAALLKLEAALTEYAERFETGKTYSFRPVIDELRTAARGELHAFHCTREYRDPAGLIACITDKSFRMAAKIQSEGGSRIRETALIREPQLVGVSQDRYTGRQVGLIHLTRTGTKGGRERQIHVEVDTYVDLSTIIKTSGEFRIDHNDYREALRQAARRSDQPYNGSHGLRYSFAQRRYRELRLRGLGDVEAKLQVSQEMGHSRPIITEWYLSSKSTD